MLTQLDRLAQGGEGAYLGESVVGARDGLSEGRVDSHEEALGPEQARGLEQMEQVRGGAPVRGGESGDDNGSAGE